MRTKPSAVLCILVLLTTTNLSFAQEKGRLPMALTAVVPRHFPPQYLVDEKGNPSGFAIEVMDQIAAMAGLNLTYSIADSWTEADQILRSGKADLIPNLGITDARNQYLAFSLPVEVAPVRIFVRLRDRNLKGPQDLSGHRVAAVSYNVGVSLFEHRDDIQLVVFDTPAEALFELLSGAVDALVYPEPGLRKIARQIEVERRIQSIGEPLIVVKRAIAVRKENQELLNVLNRAIGEFVGSSRYQEIYEKWYGKPEPFWTALRVAWLMGSSLLLVLGGMGVWRYLGLRRLNLQLTRTIEARRDAEAALEKTEERLRAIFDFSTDCIIVSDRDHKILYINPVGRRLFNLEIGRNLQEVMDGTPETLLALTQGIDRVFRTGEAIEFEGTASLGATRRFAQIKLSPMHDSSGHVFAVGVISRDITELKDTEARLEQQLHWTTVLNAISRSIAGRNDIHSILRVVLQHLEESLSFHLGGVSLFSEDRKAAVVCCVSSKDPALQSRLRVENGAELPADWSAMTETLQTNQVNILSLFDHGGSGFSRSKEEGLECAVLIPIAVEKVCFGTLFMFFKQQLSLNDYQRSFLNGLAEQVSLAARQRELYRALEASYAELKKNQQSMMEQERLNAMGQMASGIVHDINNTLAPITLYTEALLESEPNLSERARRFLQTIMQATKDIETTTVRMREFYRKREDSAGLQAFDLRELMSQVIELSRPRWTNMPNRKGLVVNVELELPEELPPVAGIPGEIREALINLLFNAVDAMPEGGQVRLRVTIRDPYVVIEVADTGKGMDEEQKRRCLEPFYTTKGENGTGLGLAMVYGVMQRHAGDIEIESSPGKGTTVRLLFPQRKSEISAAVPQESLAHLPPLRILFIDDDPLVLGSMKELLSLDGHLVIGLPSGEAGVERFRAEKKNSPGFDIVVTDLGMPHMDGLQVAREIKQLSPSTPVILLSGWGNYSNINGEKPEWVDLVLGKPTKMNDLRIAIRRLLDEGKG